MSKGQLHIFLISIIMVLPYLLVIAVWEFITMGDAVWSIFDWPDHGRAIFLIYYLPCLLLILSVEDNMK
jgi:hypothetical protein